MSTESSRSNDGANDGAKGGGGGSAADIYIGSLISLTSKFEIRYEGLLSSVDTTNATLALCNVRSFGTEGRRKEGAQVAASDQVYEYIVFRGSDIKDLQFKSSPPAQTAASVHDDPAIIQSNYSLPPAPSSFPTAPETSSLSGGSSNFSTQNPQSGLPCTTYQNSTPLYHHGGSLPSCNPSLPPTANSSSAPPGPMYWPGYNGSSSASVQPQQPFLPPVQSLPMQPAWLPPLAQQAVLYPNMNSSFPNGASNILASHSMGFPPPPLQPIITSSVNLSSTMLPSQSSALPVNSSSTIPSKGPPQAVAVVSHSTNLPLDRITVPTLIPNLQKPNFTSPIPFNSLSEPLSSDCGTSSSRALVTPGQFLHPGPTISQSSQVTNKDFEVVQAPSFGSLQQPHAGVPVRAAPVPVSAQTQAPLLPLPSPVNPKMNGASSHTRYVNDGGYGRGRGRGNEFSHSVPNYNEEFDFEAMNERFNKDEIWGHLGKSTSKNDDGQNIPEEDDAVVSAADKKPTYKKDDFFDTLSCTSLDHGSRSGRPRFSEQQRANIETFGGFSRNQVYQGGRGPGRGGWSQGGYHGRGGYRGRGGYGDGGRGRGQGQGQW